MTKLTGRGGPGRGQGRKANPEKKYRGLYLKLPQHQLEWLRQHREKANEAVNAFIVGLIEEAINKRSRLKPGKEE